MSDNSPNRPVRVVIVDDTKTIRAMIRALLARAPGIEVVGEAGDPYEAREMIRALDPDVITLDVVMPRMDGLSFLDKVMRLRPMPVIMVSTRTTEKSTEAVRALELGAFDCVDLGRLTKGDTPVGLDELVLAAAKSNPRGRAVVSRRGPAVPDRSRLNWNGRAVVIGSSTGGVEALMTVLSHFPKDCPPTLIAQHMPAPFLESFADRLDRHAAPQVTLARDGGELRQGMVQLAPGGQYHAVLDKTRAPFVTRLVKDEGNELYVPSVNILFSSAVHHGKRIVGVMLTGMGRDGAGPMLDMRRAGAHTIVQDGASCVVDGMPKAARNIGAAVEVASLKKIGPAILDHVVRQEQEKIA